MNVSRRNEAESANDDEGGDDKDDEELQGRVEMVPMELLVLQECQRQMLGATVRLTQSMMFEEENETYYAVLMPDLGPRTMSLAEFNRYPRNELRAHKVKKIFQNICKQVRLFQKLGLFHGDLKGNNENRILI